jgi:maltose O-acetyltransferase
LPIKRAFLRAATRMTPTTRWYRFRVRLLKAQGFAIDPTARIVASASFLLHDVTIGRETFVGHRFAAYGGPGSSLAIGDFCDIGPDVCVLAGTHSIAGSSRRAGRGKGTAVTIAEGSWVGGRATLIGPCSVGPGAIVAAGATVRSDIPAGCLYFGPRPTDLRPLES